MSDAPLVHVIVLNYNGQSHLEYCLPSICSSNYPNFEVVLVDNGSSDESLEYVKSEFPSLDVLALDSNLGYAGGNNVAIRHAIDQEVDYVVLANNDIRVHPEWLSAAVEAAESDCAVGVVGFDVFGAVQSVPLEDYERAVDEWEQAAFENTDEFINGMALFARIEVFEAVGLLDEAFFAYAEEIDLQKRAEAAGYRRVRTNVPVWHYSSGSWGKLPLKASYFEIRNQIRLSIKHQGVVGIFRRILSLYYTGCYPLLNPDRHNKVIRRRRPRNVVFNFLIITYCVLWNLVHLPWTLRRRWRERALIREAEPIDEDPIQHG